MKGLAARALQAGGALCFAGAVVAILADYYPLLGIAGTVAGVLIIHRGNVLLR